MKGLWMMGVLLGAVLLMGCMKTPGEPETVRMADENTREEESMKMLIGEEEIAVKWEENEAAAALIKKVEEGELTLQMRMYGGFEQVGALGMTLPREDRQITTQAGDIVLYAGDQIVVFYGSNTWSYTRLGKICDLTGEELEDLLSKGDVTITLSR